MDLLGHKRDAAFYLKLFTSGRPESFAIIAVSPEVLASGLDALALDLSWLAKLGLFPVLVLQAPVASCDFPALKKIKILSLDLTQASRKDIARIVRQRTFPMHRVDNQRDRNSTLVHLTRLLETRKLIFLTSGGTFMKTRSKIPIDMINLREVRRLGSYCKALSQENAALLVWARDILRKSHASLHIAVTSPLALLRELFTVKGAGTLIYTGSKINKFRSLADLDLARLKILLESSFEKKLRRSVRNQAVDVIYLEETYQGAAFIREVGHYAYLSKFAVGLQARGLGVGRDLWQCLTRDYPRLLWRADPHNLIASWYAKVCDGMQKGKHWNVYWIGLKDIEILEAIRYARTRERDFKD
jgi:acetylglutamate kinase